MGAHTRLVPSTPTQTMALGESGCMLLSDVLKFLAYTRAATACTTHPSLKYTSVLAVHYNTDF